MCGICGIVYLDREKKVDPGLLRTMANEIVHRGPNDDGCFVEDNVGLSMRRLSIIDLAGGRQPIFNEDGTILTVYNGEIWNYLEVRAELKKRGHVFKTQSDTEVLVHAYEEFGTDMFSRINGMFAFAIYDRRKRKLLIGRDRLGVKPLYWSMQEGALIFASEVKSFTKAGIYGSSLDTEALHHYLSFRFVPSPLTLFKGVKKLPAAHYLEFREGQSEPLTRRYWDIHYNDAPNTVSFKDASAAIHDIIEDAVRIRLMSEVPLGIMLSGGVDSAVVTAMMHKHMAGRTQSFTVDYQEEGPHREGAYAKITADAFCTDHHEIIVEFGNFMEQLDAMIYHMDEPIADPAAIPIYDLCRFARQHVTVLLSGIGGDEAFAGYSTYQEALWRSAASLIPRSVWRRFLAPLYRLIPFAMPGRNFILRLGHPLKSMSLGSSFVYGGFSEEQKQKLYTPEFAEHQKGLSSHTFVEDTAAGLTGTSDLKTMQYIDLQRWLADSHLIMMDKMSMAHSIELREPLLDYRLIEYAAQLPDSYLRTFGESKRVFKAAFAAEVPQVIRSRPKRGFSTPLDIWFRSPDTGLHQVLVSPGAAIHDYVSRDMINALFEQYNCGRGDYSANIFTLLVLERWIRTFA